MQDLQDQTSVDYKQNKTDTKAPEKVTYVQLYEGGARTKENGRKGSHTAPAGGAPHLPKERGALQALVGSGLARGVR